jgi:hypothetical protein
MSNRLSQEKANAIAAEYVTNGFQKVLALLKQGYKPSYANSSRGLVLYDNALVKTAIERLQAETKLNNNLTVAKIVAEHDRLQALCEKKGDLSSATANLVAKGKTIGAYKDVADVNQFEQAKALTEQEQAEAARLANIRLRTG